MPKLPAGTVRTPGGEGYRLAFGRVVFAFVGAIGLAALVWGFVARARATGVVNEDSFISFRYARNLLAGDGLIFNPGGERVEGITNLLWTLVVAGAGRLLDVPLPEASVALGLICGALTLAVAVVWGYREISRSAGRSAGRDLGSLVASFIAPAVLVLAPGFAFYAVSGLEVALFSLLLTAGLFCVCRDGSLPVVVLGSVLLGLAAMTRPEGVLVLGVAALCCAFAPGGGREKILRLLAAGVPGGLVVAGFTAWRFFYYGSVLPNTAYAKAGGMEVVERWGLPYLINAASGNWFGIAYLLVLGGALLDRSFLRRSLALLVITPLWCAYLAYAGGDYMPFHRLLLPLLPALYVLGTAGFARVAALLVSNSGGYARAAAVVGVLAAALVAPVFVQLPDLYEREKARQEHDLQDNRDRREVAAWFRENDPEATIARNGVGVVGYYTELEIVDMLGLNDRHIARNGRKDPATLPGHQSSDAAYVLDREPEYIMVASLGPTYRFPGDRELVRSDRLHEKYDLVSIELDSGRKIKTFHHADSPLAASVERISG
ncbi:hypothetical protein [Rubrobacter indicoceani]|uniref:hypothetical protein n=1 Tax=Rubrobacter indicoceani TaxID=2051957 RepID=UPI000E5B822E|nr:hypothetical protein [Rubrobacter indicoceani]